MKFELFQDQNEQWLWRLRDDAGREIARTAETFSNKKHAYLTIDRILETTDAEIIDVRQ